MERVRCLLRGGLLALLLQRRLDLSSMLVRNLLHLSVLPCTSVQGARSRYNVFLAFLCCVGHK